MTGLRGIPQVMGGIESHCEELYPRLHALLPQDAFTIVARSPYVSPNPKPYRGTPIISVFAIRNKYFETILHTFLAVIVVRFRLRCDTIHIHGIGPALLSPLARLLGLKLIVTHHGEDFNRAKWNWLAKIALHAGEWCAVRAAHALIVVSDTLAQDLLRRHPKQAARIGYIPNGASRLPTPVDMPGGTDAVLASLGLERGGYVLAVGRLVPEKGFHDLVEAFGRSSATTRLVIAGSTDHEDSYARALLGEASDRVRFVGFQKHAVLRALYEGAALFVLPSYHEGLPIAALEAAAAGCPMLLSDIAPNREIGLTPHGYFPVGDVQALADKLNEAPTTFAVDSQAITDRFDWAKVAVSTAAVYRKVAAIA